MCVICTEYTVCVICTECTVCVSYVQSVQCVCHMYRVYSVCVICRECTVCVPYVQSVQCVSQLTTADSPSTCPTHCLAHILGSLELKEYRSTSPLERTVVFLSLKN